MPATTSTSREQRWLRTRLNTVGLPVFRGQAPEGQTLANGTLVIPNTTTPLFPCIVFRRQGGTDIQNIRGTYMVRSIWLVFVAGRSTFQAESQASVNALEANADSMHASIYDASPVTQNGRVIEGVRRESEWDSSVIENGVEYIQLGGTYRILSTVA